MDMSSLSIEELGRLSDLLDELGEIVERKENIIKDIALIDMKKMNQALDVKNKSNEKASKITIDDLSMLSNIDEMKKIVSSNLDSSYEMHEIDENARKLNVDLDELKTREEYVRDEIKSLVKVSSVDNNKENIIEVMNTTIKILDKKLPSNISNISPEADKIIECTKNLIAEITNLLSKYTSTSKVVDTNIFENYSKLRDRVKEYENEKNRSDDKQLEMLKKPELEVKEPIQVEIPKEEEKPVIEVTSDEPKVEEPEIDTTPERKIEVDSLESLENLQKQEKEEKPADNLVPLSTYLENKNVNQPVKTNESSERSLLIKNGVNPDLVRTARTKKSKLSKIMDNTAGSYVSVKVMAYEDSNKINPTEAGFNLDSFINQTAA